MNRAIVGIIGAYQRHLSPRLSRRCLFAESCSAHVARVLLTDGTLAGLKALLGRLRRCRPGYQYMASLGGGVFVLRDGSTLLVQDSSDELRSLIALASTAELRLNTGAPPRPRR